MADKKEVFNYFIKTVEKTYTTNLKFKRMTMKRVV